MQPGQSMTVHGAPIATGEDGDKESVPVISPMRTESPYHLSGNVITVTQVTVISVTVLPI